MEATLDRNEVRQWKRYAEYRSKRSDWLPSLPTHWKERRLKFIADFAGGGTPSKDNREFWNGDIPWVSPKDMKSFRVSNSEDHITSAGLENSSTQMVPAGSVLIVARSGILKHTIPVAINDRPVAINQDLKVVLLDKSNDLLPEYFAYLVAGNQDALLFQWKKEGATVESLELELIGDTPTPLPPLPEQRAIAAFLDRETARIDALIGHKQRLIALLEEKRQAVISHAVTKGLNPSVDMKPFGEFGVSEIPKHWTATRLKYATPCVTVGVVITPAKYYVPNGVVALRGTNVREGVIREEDLVYFSEEGHRLNNKSKLCAGDLVAVRSGQPGTTAVVPDHLHDANCIDLILIRQSKRFNSQFLCYLANSRFAKLQYGVGTDGAIQQHFNVETAQNMVVILPPKEEQEILVGQLDHAIGRITKLSSQIQLSIDRLQEYRTTLISAAVTGQIDVREEAELDG